MENHKAETTEIKLAKILSKIKSSKLKFRDTPKVCKFIDEIAALFEENFEIPLCMVCERMPAVIFRGMAGYCEDCLGKRLRKTLMRVSEFTVGGRTYELVPILAKDESCVSGDTMVKRAEKLNASLDDEDGTLILEHQHEIPEGFRGKFYLVFTRWRHPSYPQRVTCLRWSFDRWCRDCRWLGYDWNELDRLVRRVK